MMRTFLIIGLALSCLWVSTPAHAKIYKWVDEKGKVHFTNDPTKVPKTTDTNVETYRELNPPVKKLRPPETSPGISIPKPTLPPEGQEGEIAIEKSQEKENQRLQQRQAPYQKLLQSSERTRDQRLKKIEELKNLDHKPEGWTNEKSLEEIIEELQEEVKKTEQEIKKYKEKSEPPVIQD